MPQDAVGSMWSENFAEPGASCCGMMEFSCVQASDSILLRSSVGMVMKEVDAGEAAVVAPEPAGVGVAGTVFVDEDVD